MFAIINIILGTNLSGDEKTCLINKKCDASYGELHFVDNNGNSHILIRGKDKYNSQKNFVSLDGKIVSQTDLISFYKDKKLFLSILNPLYFLNKKPAEQKELVDKYLSDIRAIDVFDSLDTNLKETLLKQYSMDIETFQTMEKKAQEEFISKHMINIFMNIAYSNLDKKEQEILEGIPLNIPTYISELNEDIKKAQTVISTLNGKIEYAQTIVDEEIPEKKEFSKETELSLALQELDYLSTNKDIISKEKQQNIVKKMEKEILDKETEAKQLEKQMKEGKERYLAIKNGISTICPTCEQHITDEKKGKAIQNLKKELISYFDKSNLLNEQITNLKFDFSVERCKLHSLEGKEAIEREKRIEEIKYNIEQLENEKQEIEILNSEIEIKEKNAQSAKLDITKFNKDKQSRNDFIEQATKAKQVAQKLYISYIEEKMKLAKQYLKDVNIKFYSVLRTTGELREDFIITYKNTPLSDLSRSETIATALEFANMFNKISRVNLPIFIDDYESCADYNFIQQYGENSQLIVSKVEKGNLLKIADYNSNACTIIKPHVKGYRTSNKLFKRSEANIQKAA